MTAPTSRVVRVFISSTFRDFGAEHRLRAARASPQSTEGTIVTSVN
jgi:hypothetical protein